MEESSDVSTAKARHAAVWRSGSRPPPSRDRTTVSAESTSRRCSAWSRTRMVRCRRRATTHKPRRVAHARKSRIGLAIGIPVPALGTLWAASSGSGASLGVTSDPLGTTRDSRGTSRAALATPIDALVSACDAQGMPRAALAVPRAALRASCDPSRSTESVSRCDDGRSRFDESRSRRLLRGGSLEERLPECPERRLRCTDSRSRCADGRSRFNEGRARRRECDKYVRLGGGRFDLRRAWHTLAPIDHFERGARQSEGGSRHFAGVVRVCKRLARHFLRVARRSPRGCAQNFVIDPRDLRLARQWESVARRSERSARPRLGVDRRTPRLDRLFMGRRAHPSGFRRRDARRRTRD